MIPITLEVAVLKIQTALELAVGLALCHCFQFLYLFNIFLGVDSITCNGQGTCSSGNSGICACDSGFTGDRCNITTCPGTPICSISGNCPEGGTVCECQAGFFGDDCAGKFETSE